MSKIITQNEYIQMVQENNKYVDIVGKYTGMKNKISCRCKICGGHYEAAAYDVKIGKKHRDCASKISGTERLKSNDTFIEEIRAILPYISLLEPYAGAHKKILCCCAVHNEVFKSAPTKLLAGKCGCQKCRSDSISAALRKSHTDFVHQLSLLNDQIDVIGQYTTSNDRIEVMCKVCGFVWQPIAGSLLSGCGCPHCVGRHKTTDEFKREIYDINSSIDIIGEYIDSHTKIKCRCNVCGYEWYPVASRLRYSGCPQCNISHGELAIKKYLQSHNIDFISQKTFPGLVGIRGGDLSYDFQICGTKILIEYQGEFHDGTAYQQTHEQYEIQKEHDKRKRNYALHNGYKLIEIWYWDYDNIDKILERELC